MKKENKEKLNINQMTNFAQAVANNENIQTYGSATKEHLVAYSGIDNENAKELTKSLKSISEQKINPEFAEQNLKQQAGFAAEVKYTARQNAENIIQKNPNRIIRTDDAGAVNHELYDHIEIKNGIADFSHGEQMKFVGNSPEQAYERLKSSKFEKYLNADAKITVPSDYYDGIKENANKEITNLKQQLEHAKTNGNTKLADNLQNKIKKAEKIRDNLKNSEISNKEAM